MRFSSPKLSRFALLNALLFSGLDSSDALQANLRARKIPGAGHILDRRATSTVVSAIDEYDTGYSMAINLGGVDLEVLIDLGSTDLTIQAQIPNSHNTTVPVTFAYGVGNGTGFINQATLGVGAFSVENQAYVLIEDSQDLGFPDGVSGIFGVGPRFNSDIFELLNETLSSESPLDRIISGNTNVDNYITLLLNRVLDGDSDINTDHGSLTIGSVLDSYQDILKQPKLPMWLDPFGIIFQHWETLMDEDGLIGPDGQPVSTSTIYKFGPRNQLKAMFDSGWTFPAVPDYVAEAIYGRVPNAFFNASGPYWSIPCSYELNISFSFDGVKYPVHPLDMSTPFDLDNNTLANNTCMGTYQPYNFTQSALSGGGGVDIIMGMSFLRNAYFLGNYGNLTSSLNASSQLPYIQLLSTTDPTVAHQEFVKVRLGGKDTTHSQPGLLPASAINNGTSKSTDVVFGSISNNTDGTKKPWYKRPSAIISIVTSSIVLLLAVLGIAAYCWRARKRSSKVPRESAFAPDMIGKSSYKPLLAEAEPMASGGRPPRSETPEPWENNGRLPSPGAGNTYSYGGYEEPKYEHT